MSNILNAKILLRTDDLSNWNEANPVLSNGEAAVVVKENGSVDLKIGSDGKRFSELEYLHETELSTKALRADSVQQGVQVEATPYGMAGGFFVKNSANYAQGFGTHVSVAPEDAYSFTWSGDPRACLCVDHENRRVFVGHAYYPSKGPGTFAVNPKEGLSGFYVGDRNLAEIAGAKVKVGTYENDEYVFGDKGLSVVRIKSEDYMKLVATSSELSDVTYVISSDDFDVFGRVVKNATMTDDPEISEAATKHYVDQKALSSGGVKVAFDDDGDFVKTDLSVWKISQEKYRRLVEEKSLNPSCLYVVSAEKPDAYGQRIENVGYPRYDTDAATKQYVDEHSGGSDAGLCAYVEGLEKDLYGQDRDRSLFKMSESQNVVETLSAMNSKLSLDFDFSEIDTYEECEEFLAAAYAELDVEYSPAADAEDFVGKIETLAKREEFGGAFKTDMKSYVLGLNGEIDEIKSKTTAISSNVESLKTKTAQHDQRLDSHFSIMSRTQNDLTAVQANVTNLNRDVNEIKTEFESYGRLTLSGEYEDGSTFKFAILTAEA